MGQELHRCNESLRSAVVSIVWRYAAVTAAVLAVLGGVYLWGAHNEASDWERKWAQRDAAEAIVRSNAVQAAREEEQKSYAARDEAARVAREQTKDIDTAGTLLAAGFDGLRLDTAGFVQRASSCPQTSATPDRSAATTRAAMVLSELLDRSFETNRELAQAYDRARVAGLTCEKLSE